MVYILSLDPNKTDTFYLWESPRTENTTKSFLSEKWKQRLTVQKNYELYEKRAVAICHMERLVDFRFFYKKTKQIRNSTL